MLELLFPPPPPTRMTAECLGVETKKKQTKQAHVRKRDSNLKKFLQKLSFPPAARLTSHLECDENGNNKKGSPKFAVVSYKCELTSTATHAYNYRVYAL